MPSALVIGGGECWLDDAKRALEMFEPDAFFVVNDMINLWPLRIDYMVTLHPDKIEKFLRGHKNKINFEIWSHKRWANVVHKIIPDWAGSSGLFAVKVAMQESFAPIVLAGVPMVSTYGHAIRKQKWTAAEMFRKGWTKHLAEIKPITRSMSGWTQELLGSPTPEWLSTFGSAAPNHEVIRKLKEMADGLAKDSTRESR